MQKHFVDLFSIISNNNNLLFLFFPVIILNGGWHSPVSTIYSIKRSFKISTLFLKMPVKSGRELRNYIRKTPEDGTTDVTTVYQPQWLK